MSAQNIDILKWSKRKSSTFFTAKKLKKIQIKAFRVNQQTLSNLKAEQFIEYIYG